MTASTGRRPYRVVAFTYGELASPGSVATLTGIAEGRIRSLRAHPYAAPGDLAVLAAVDERGPAAGLAIIPGRMRIDGRTERIDWASSWSARSDTPGAGADLLLRASRTGASFGGHLLSPDALRVYRALRAELIRIPRLVRILRSRPYWGRHVPRRVGAAAGTATDVLAAAVAAAAGIGVGRAAGWIVDEMELPDERLDAVEATRPYGFTCDHRELRWAMTSPWDASDGLRYRTFYLRRAGSREVSGFAWVRARTYRGAHAVSLFRTGVATGDDGAMQALVDGVLDCVHHDGVDLVDVAGTDGTLRRAVRSRGFLPYGHIDAGCVFAPAVRHALALAGASLASIRLNMAEGDVLFL